MKRMCMLLCLGALASSGVGTESSDHLLPSGYIDILDCGAVGDGVTDDSEAIQAAFDICPDGGAVVFSPGCIYLAKSAIIISKSVTIVGYGATLKCGGGLMAVGTTSRSVSLAKDAGPGDPNVLTVDGSWFAPGDSVLLQATTEIGIAEVHAVRDVAGNKVMFQDLVRWHHDNQDKGDPPEDADAEVCYCQSTLSLYDPIEFNVYGLRFELTEDNYRAIVANKIHHSTISNCEFHLPVARPNVGYYMSFTACQHLTFENNRMWSPDDMLAEGSKGPLFQYCEFVNFRSNESVNRQSYVTRFKLCYGVNCEGNRLYRCQAMGLYFNDCKRSTCSSNQVYFQPGQTGLRENYEASRVGLMFDGTDGMVATGNLVQDGGNGGEGNVYWRSGNYRRNQIVDDGSRQTYYARYFAPNQDFVFSNNIVSQSDPNSQVLGRRAFYAKSRGRRALFADNIFESTGTVFSLYGGYDDIQIHGNTFTVAGTNSSPAVYLRSDPSGTWAPAGAFSLRDNLMRGIEGDGGKISLQFDDEAHIVITGNDVYTSGSADDSHLLNIGRYGTGPIGNTVLRITGNVLKAANTAGARRGIYIHDYVGVPSLPGSWLIRDNVIDVPGPVTATAGDYMLEWVSMFDDADTTLQTYGISDKLWEIANTVPTQVTRFAGGTTNQTIHVIASTDNTTLIHGSGIELSANTDYTMTRGEVLSFVYDGDTWNQMGVVTHPTRRVDLTSDEIKTLLTRPKELVAAPGKGMMLELISATLIFKPGSSTLTGNANRLAIVYDNGHGPAASTSIASDGFVAGKTDMLALMHGIDLLGGPASDSVGKNLSLISIGDAEYSGNPEGDASMTVTLTYRVHDVQPAF